MHNHIFCCNIVAFFYQYSQFLREICWYFSPIRGNSCITLDFYTHVDETDAYSDRACRRLRFVQRSKVWSTVKRSAAPSPECAFAGSSALRSFPRRIYPLNRINPRKESHENPTCISIALAIDSVLITQPYPIVSWNW